MNMETKRTYGETLAMLGCVVPGAAVLAVGMGVYYFVAENLDTVTSVAGIVGAVLAVALLVWLIVSGCGWLVRATLDLWHELHLRKAQQATAYAMAERAQIENQAATLRTHLVELTADVQLIPVDQVNAQAAYTLLSQRIATLEKRVPDSMHLTVKSGNQLPAPPPPEASVAPALQVRDFWQLYHADQLPSDRFLLGYNLETGAPVQAGWTELYSALVGGVSRSGKSTLIRGVLAQAALQGSKFVIVDKHFAAGNDSMAASLVPLRPWMLTDIATSEGQMLDTLRLVRGVAEARLNGRDRDKTPLVLVVDEATGLFMRSNLAEELTGLLGLLTQESAKCGVFAIVIGQQWTAEVLPTTVRNSFVSAISCRARRDVARVMSGSTEFAKIAESLQPPGQAVWMQPNGEIVRLAIPNCTAHHIELVARQLSTGVYTAESVAPISGERGLLSVGESVGESVAESVDSSEAEQSSQAVDITLTVDPTKAALVRQLYRDGKSRSQVLKAVWNVDNKSGNRFMLASRELDAIMRALLK